jgi:hypothetical protein
MSDEKVPVKMRGIDDEIVALTDEICVKHLSQEYADGSGAQPKTSFATG